MTEELDRRSIDQVLTTTRAVRRRMDFSRPVDPAVIRECIELAIYAPSARNEQDWRWIIVTDPAGRAPLAELLRRPGGAEGRSTGRAPDPRISRSAGYLSEHLEDVPAYVLASILTRLPPNASGRVLADFYGSIIPAVWSLQLALRSRGLGSVFTTRFLAHEREVAALLGIPEDVTPVAMIPVAHYTGELTRPPRRPVDDVVFWEKWGGRRPDRA